MKATSAESQNRITLIHGMLLNGAQRHIILQHAAKEWGISTRQADEYIRKARDVMSENASINRDEQIALALERMNHVIYKCLKAQDFQRVIAAQREINQLLGLYMPDKQEHSGEVKTVIEFVFPE